MDAVNEIVSFQVQETALIQSTRQKYGVGICLDPQRLQKSTHVEYSTRIPAPKIGWSQAINLLKSEGIYMRATRSPNSTRISCHRKYPSAHKHSRSLSRTTAVVGRLLCCPNTITTLYASRSMISSESTAFLLHNYEPTAHVRASHALLRRVHHRQTFSSCVITAFAAKPFQQSGRQSNQPRLCTPERQKKTQTASGLERVSC